MKVALAVFTSMALTACASLEPASPTPDPQALVGTWKVDLRRVPTAPDYFKEFVVTSVTGKGFAGSFYGTPVEEARINIDWGAVRIAFVTSDRSGSYNHSAVLAGGKLDGLTNSLGRNFLSYWSAVKQDSSPIPTASAPAATTVSAVAKGTFTVAMKPEGEPLAQQGVTTGRMSLVKTFEGELQGTGEGLMLTALTPVAGSAGYVAIERVSATLQGRKGSFVFQHTGTMNRGAQQLAIGVVPDSGTGQLEGLAGSFVIRIEGRQHFYEFAYTLPKP